MTNRKRLSLYGKGGLALLVSAFMMTPAVAQDDDDDADEEQIEEIVTTGSRIARDTFSTTTPLQVLDADEAQRIGIANISELLQKATVASGQQIDGTINNNAGQTNASEAPPEGGVGSACINLRGLGCERTLVLVNSKRLGLAGIRGAPPQPDINMLPIGMVEAVDVLTGGLSTIYGADAVAGVVNVRLKKDFEGLNFSVTSETPEEEGGDLFAASMTAGVTGDLGNFTIGLEYSAQQRVRTGDREFARCLRRGAQVITRDGQTFSVCRSDFPDNWAVTQDNLFNLGYTEVGGDPTISGVDATRLLYTPGTSNILDPNGNPVIGYSTFSAIPQPSDPSLRNFPNTEFNRTFYLDRFRYDPRFNDQNDRANADLFRPYDRFSLVMNGHLNLDWGNNEELYFEGYYFNRTNDVIGAREQIFPTVPGMVPLVDSTNTPILDANGAMQMVDNPLNPFPTNVEPILTLEDVSQNFDTELQQIRIVSGIVGDLPFAPNWSYDGYVSYDRATGFVNQTTLLENQLFNALQTVGVVADENGNPTSETVCGPRTIDNGGFFTLGGCTPVNLFASSIPGDGITDTGRFATQAERDYLLGNRTNRTVTELTTFNFFVTGDLFDVPGGGTVSTAFGVEYRIDEIDSQNSAVGVLGLNAAENGLIEGETRGERDTIDVYAEISAPLFVDMAWGELFQVDAAVRFTDDENFGDDSVYKLGYLWDINEYVSWSSSFNTSFRAPNLREQFLADQAGALPGSNDPCRQPAIALAEPSPALDRLLNNCALSGADVTQLGTAFTVAIPTSIGGAAGLKPETSESFTSTLNFSQPWTDAFDFDVALTYFNIEIEDTVRSLEPATIVARCFNDQPNLQSPFCDRVERNRPNAPPAANFISFVRAGFVNTGIEETNGFDISTRMSGDFRGASYVWTTGTTILGERLAQEFPPSEDDPNGSAIVDNVGRIGNPETTFQSTLNVSFNEWDITWQARWFDDQQFAQGVVNPLILDENNLIEGGPFDGQSCADAFPEDGCTDFGFFNSSQFDTDTFGPVRGVTEAEAQWQNDLSVTYNADQWRVTAGINNIFNEEPPLIDQGGGPNRNNAVTSARYDQIGRSFFLRANIGF
ncbi:MAG: TonB-dependent receptor [Pseudomonadota bacterium]